MGAYTNRKKNFSRRNYRRRSRENLKTEDTGMICSLCNKPLKELHSAMVGKENNEPLHFDCVVKLLLKNEELEPADKICYLGNGSFGIITFRNSSSPIRFLIKKRIKFEEFKEIPEWRKNSAIKLMDIKSKVKNTESAKD